MAAKLNRLAREVSDTKRPLFVTALAGKQIFAGTAAAAGATRLARARFDMMAGDRAVIRYAGAKAHLVNNPTKPHRIEPRRRRRGGVRKALTIGGDVKASANHPGTRGKRFFEAAREICIRELPQVYRRAQITEPLKRIF